jgi:hypothetical protein
MPRRREPPWKQYLPLVYQAVTDHNYKNMVGIINDPIPKPDGVRDFLEEHLRICSDRTFRVFRVEDCKYCSVFIQVPGVKTDYDFFVWRAKFESGRLVDLKVPSHDDLATQYNALKSSDKAFDEHLINAVIKLIHPSHRWGVPRIINHYFVTVEEGLKVEASAFLSTLKWIALEEDANYPPSEGKMGSKYTLAVYALLESGFTLSEIRRVVRF